jgi:hypothetical protein
LQKRSGRRTIADKPDIQIEFRRHLQRPPHGRLDPSFVVAESAATDAGEEDDIRRRAAHADFIGHVENLAPLLTEKRHGEASHAVERDRALLAHFERKRALAGHLRL